MSQRETVELLIDLIPEKPSIRNPEFQALIDGRHRAIILAQIALIDFALLIIRDGTVTEQLKTDMAELTSRLVDKAS
jgi:hypothetical protein